LLFLKSGRVGRCEFDVGVGIGWAAGDVVDDFLAGDARDHYGLVFVEIFNRGLFEAGGSGGLVSSQIFAEIAGVASVLVVAVEGVSDTAETAKALETGDLLGEVNGASGVELLFGWAVGLQFADLLPEGGFEVFELHVWFGGDRAFGDTSQFERVVGTTDRLRDLLFVHEDLIEPAGLSAAEDIDKKIDVCVTGGIDSGRQEGYAELRKLDGVGDGGALLFGDRCGGHGDRFGCGSFGDRAEVFGEERLQFGGIKVTGDRETRVVWGVELFEEVADIVEAGCFDVGVGADDIGVVGMIFGKEELIDFFAPEVIGSTFALAALVADNVALVREFFAVEAFKEETHAVAFEPEGELELVAGDGFEVVGAVEVRGAVDVGCPGALNVFNVGLFADVLGAFKHHVFEEMGKAGTTRALVQRADVIPKVDGDQREAVIFMHDDDETVGHRELFVLELGNLQRLGSGEAVRSVSDGCDGERKQKRGGERAFGNEQRCFHLFSREAGKDLEECLLTRIEIGSEMISSRGRHWPGWCGLECLTKAEVCILRPCVFMVFSWF
jgi:hypothetical protein